MNTIRYKGYYIHINLQWPEVEAICSPSGYGYTWRRVFSSLHAAKCAITRHIKGEPK
jgi:hypothetical protein